MAYARPWFLAGILVLSVACGDDTGMTLTTTGQPESSSGSTTGMESATSMVEPGTSTGVDSSGGSSGEPPTTGTTADTGESSTTGPVCGDDVREGKEACDGADLGGLSCADVPGFVSGSLSCLDDCSDFDTSQCFETPICGNNTREDPEVCDNNDLSGETCESQGFDNGALDCSNDCASFDTSGCGTCGNVIVDGAEVCDDIVLLGETCESQGFETGTLGCAPDCLSLDTSPCGICGNATTDGAEICDGVDLGGQDCLSLGLGMGTLGCVPNCLAYDTTMCELGCGNDVINGMEVCDGTDVGGETCASQGLPGPGTLSCLPDCTAFDTSTCTSGNCCVAHAAGGCEDPVCEASVCAIDSFCCSVTWDGICENEAFADPNCAC